MAEFSTTKIPPSDGVQIPSINGQVAGYQENDELKAYVLGTIPTDVSGHTADIAGIRGTSLDYDPDSTTYIKGATCILNHIVYRAKQLIPSPAGAFDSSKWEEVSLHEIARKVATNTDAITSLRVHVETVSFSNSTAQAGTFEVGKLLPTVTGKTAIGCIGHDLSRISTMNYQGIFIQGSQVYVQGYNSKGTSDIFNGNVFVLYQ